MKKVLLIGAVGIGTFLIAGVYFRGRQQQHTPALPRDVSMPENTFSKIVRQGTCPTPKSPSLTMLVDRTQNTSERIPPDMTSRFPAVTEIADIKALEFVLLDKKDNDAVRNEVANLLRRSKALHLPSLLVSVLEDAEEKSRFRAFATQHLGELLPESEAEQSSPPLYARHHFEITQKLEALLEDRHSGVRREALLALSRRKNSVALQTAARLLREESPEADAVKDLAIRCVHEAQMRELIPDVRRYSKHSNEVIRIAAIAALSQWNDHESIAAFEEASENSSPRIQRAGKMAMERIKK